MPMARTPWFNRIRQQLFCQVDNETIWEKVAKKEHQGLGSPSLLETRF